MMPLDQYFGRHNQTLVLESKGWRANRIERERLCGSRLGRRCKALSWYEAVNGWALDDCPVERPWATGTRRCEPGQLNIQEIYGEMPVPPSPMEAYEHRDRMREVQFFRWQLKKEASNGK